jgi:hypothetical protein
MNSNYFQGAFGGIMIRYKIKLQELNTPQTKQIEVTALSLSEALNNAVVKLEVSKDKWYLKKYHVMG